MNRRGIPILAALIGMVGILCLAVLVIDNVKRDQVTEQRLVDRAVEVARDEVNSATEPGGALDDAVQAEVQTQVDDALATTTTTYGPPATLPPLVPTVPTTTSTTTTTTTEPPIVTLPTLPPTTLPEIPLP